MPLKVSEIERHENLSIPVFDETVAAARYEPKGSAVDKPLPALLMYIPYHKDDYITFSAYDPLIKYLARAGYEVIVADMVGTGASTGTKDKPFSTVEGEEGKEIIEWLASREWTTDKVGMFGKSYGGITALKTAAETPPSLEAIVPIHAPYKIHRWVANDFHGMNHWTSLMQALQAIPPTLRNSSGEWVDIWNERLDQLQNGEPWLFQFLDRADAYDDYWKSMEIDPEMIETPTFAVTGWRDGSLYTTEQYIQAINAETRLLVGPWRHVMPHRGRESAIEFREQVVRWFDHFLKGAASDEWPRISFWTERNGGGKQNGGHWRQADHWPKTVSNTGNLSFAVASNGLVKNDDFTAESVERTYEFDHTVGIESVDYGEPIDTVVDDSRSLCFETDQLSDPIELTGRGRATIRLQPTTSQPLLVVRIVDVDPDGSSRLVTHGTVRAGQSNSEHGFDPLTPGEEYELTVPLKSKSHIFETGHRIKIAISGAFFPKHLPPRNHGSFIVRSSPSEPSLLTFPGKVHEQPVEFNDEIEISNPDTTIPVEPPCVSASSTSCNVIRDHFDNIGKVVTTEEFTADLPDAEMEYSEKVTAAVQADDPRTATIQQETEIVLNYGTEVITIESSSQSSHDLGRIDAQITVNGETIFDEYWRR